MPQTPRDRPTAAAPTAGASSAQPGAGRRRRRLIGLAIDATMAYGRGIMRGVLRYANSRRQWALHEEFHVTTDLRFWPKCDGTILASLVPEIVERVTANSGHVVHCSESADRQRFPVVSLDGNAVGRMAAEHLLSCRLKHFAYYGTFDERTMRFHAFRAVLAGQGFGCELFFPDGKPVLAGHARIDEMVERLRRFPKPLGVLAYDDNNARELARACEFARIQVPDQVAILGINNDDLLCESAWPPLSSVAIDFSQVGYVAAEMLDRLMNGEQLSDAERYVLVPPARVVQRQSTSLLAVDDEDVSRAVAFIREHACDPCSVSDVLRQVPVSRRSLERKFAEKLGRSPYDQINYVRIDRARRLLLESGESLDRIAAECGFSTAQTFSRVFAKTIGISPAVYRRENKAK